ncbi:MAG: DUF4340 domain-containing protein [bacterium]
MKFRNTLMLLVLTAAVGAYVYFYEIKGGEKREKEKEAAGKLVDIKKDSVAAITLMPDGVELKKTGGKWELAAPVQYQADEGTVNSLLYSLESAKRDREEIASSAAEYANYGLDPARAELIVRHEQGQQDTLYLGDSNATSTAVYARLNHDPEVVLTAKGLADNAKKPLLDWRNKDLLTFETSEVNRLLLKTPSANFELKKEDGKWQMLAPIKTAADESKISSILSRVRYGKIAEFTAEQMSDAKPYGLDKPNYEFTVFFGANDAQKSISFGKRDGGHNYAYDPARPQVFKIDTSIVKDINISVMDMRNKKLAQFESWNADYVELNYADTLKMVCEKDTSNNWQITSHQNRKAKSWKISNITGGLSSLEAAAFVDEQAADLKKYGLDKPRAIVMIKQKGSEVATVLVGKEKGDRVYAKAANSPAVVEVKKEDADKLFTTLTELAE